MRYITDQSVEAIPALADLDLETRREAFADADRVYEYLRRAEGQYTAPGVDERAIRAWADKQDGLDPDRLSRALAVLVATDRVATFT